MLAERVLFLVSDLSGITLFDSVMLAGETRDMLSEYCTVLRLIEFPNRIMDTDIPSRIEGRRREAL